jgi:hypothetical protein
MRRCEHEAPVPRQALAIAETMKDSDEKRVLQDISHDTVSYVLERMSMPGRPGFRSTRRLDRTSCPNYVA